MLLATMSRRLAWIVALVTGATLLVWQVRATGTAEIARGLRAVGVMGMLAIFATAIARFHLRAWAWLTLLRESVPLGRAVQAVIAGDAAGNLTPLGLMISEPAKAAFLRAPGGAMRALAALTAENYFFAISVAIYVLGGTAAMLWTFDLRLVPGIRASGIAAIAGMAAFLLVAAWIAWKRPGLASSIAARIPIRRVAAFVTRLQDFETTLYGTVGPATTGVRPVIAAEAAFHVLGFVEIWLTLWLMTGTSLPVEALVLDAFGRVGNVVFRLVPLQLGVLQVASELVTRAMGLAQGTGVTLSIVRTIRVLAFALVGLALFARQGQKWK
jgi:Lysylphosphatidylglycerol synthase TM region